MIHTKKCSCKTAHYGTEIEFCPLHAAASELLEDLKNILDSMERGGPASLFFRRAKETIAKAERKP